MSTSFALKKYDKVLFPVSVFSLHSKYAKCPNCGCKVSCGRPNKKETTRAFCTNCQLIFEV
jgi:hypothetical protein